MTAFPEHFGVTARTFLEDTFRCNDGIATLASRFVLRKPSTQDDYRLCLDALIKQFGSRQWDTISAR